MSLKEIRIAKGLTQTQVAVLINKDKRDISKIENEVFDLTKKDINILSQKLGCRKNDLKNFQNNSVATDIFSVATGTKTKSRVNTYNYQVRLKKGQFPLFEKNELKKRGFKSHRAFLEWAYKKLEVM